VLERPPSTVRTCPVTYELAGSRSHTARCGDLGRLGRSRENRLRAPLWRRRPHPDTDREPARRLAEAATVDEAPGRERLDSRGQFAQRGDPLGGGVTGPVAGAIGEPDAVDRDELRSREMAQNLVAPRVRQARTCTRCAGSSGGRGGAHIAPGTSTSASFSPTCNPSIIARRSPSSAISGGAKNSDVCSPLVDSSTPASSALA
jgi:hypothetical protein